jgi:uncharacterized protein (TIGR00369 family)
LKEEGVYETLYDRPMNSKGATPFELPQWIACAPFEEYLDMTIFEAKEGRALLTMPFMVKHAQGQGLMHGGAVTALADTAVAMAIKSLLPEGTNFVTTEMSLKFHAAVRGGTVKAVATTEILDERNIKGVAEVFDENGVKTATFTALFRILRSKV